MCCVHYRAEVWITKGLAASVQICDGKSVCVADRQEGRATGKVTRRDGHTQGRSRELLRKLWSNGLAYDEQCAEEWYCATN